MPEPPGASYSAGTPTANEQLVDSAIYHGLSLERVSSGMKQKIAALLTDAQEQIAGKLVTGKLTDWQAKRAQQFLDWSNKVIANTYDKIDGTVQDDLDGIKKAEIQKQINSVNSAVGMEISPAMSTQQLESIAKADELLVSGAVMGDWWAKQASNLQHNVLTTVQGGLVQGKSTQDIAKDLHGVMGEDSVTLAQAKTLARTAAATVQSEAQKAYYAQNDDIIKGIRWVSTLDDRTTPQCMALDGASWKADAKGDMWPVGHEIPFPGYPPIHWNCRSTTVPVLKSWQELSKVQLPHLKEKDVQSEFEAALKDQGFTDEQIADIQMKQQASMDGQVPEALNYEDWLKTKDEATQKQILGPARWQLWKDGKVSLMDMVKKDTLEPLTVEELQATAQKNMAMPPPAPIADGMHGLSLAERQILTAQMTSEATSGETWASWLNPNNGVTVDQTLKYSVNAQEAAQLAAQDKLVHLSNTASNAQLWGKSDAALWAGQSGFSEAKLVTPSGRVISARLKEGKTWTAADAQKWWMKMEEAADEGIDDPFAQMRYAFGETGNKMILTQTEPGAIKLDSSTMKKVYGPVHEEDKPLSYFEAHTNQLELQKEAELAKAQAAIKEQMKVADAAAQTAAKESQLARQKQAELQQKVAEQRLAAAEKEAEEAAASLAKYKAEQLAKEQAAEQEALRKAAADRAAQLAQEQLAAAQQEQKEAQELADKLAKKKKASEAAKKAAATKAKNKQLALEKAAAEAKAAEEAAAKAKADAEWKQVLSEPIDVDYINAFHDQVVHLQEEIEAAYDAGAVTQAEQLEKSLAETKQQLQELIDAHTAQQQAKAAADAADAAAKAEAAAKAAKAEADAQAKLIKQQKAAAKKTAAAPVNTHGQMDLPVEPKAAIKTNFPADPWSLKEVKDLGGYTHAKLVEDADGNQWVRKTGDNPAHITNEALFDHLYRIAGVDIPESKLYSTPQGPVKLSRYIPDTTILGDYLKGLSPQAKADLLRVVENQFVANALFSNWDAVGANPQAGFDNILINKAGTKAYMIDTGGAGEFKGTGTITRGKFGPKVEELQTLKDPLKNATTAPIFKGVTDQQVVDQSVKIFQVRKDLLAATPEPLRSKLEARLNYLDDYVTELVAEGKAVMPPMGLPPEPAAAKAPVKPSEPSWASEPKVVQDIKDSGISGIDLWSDKDKVEDAHALAWTEADKLGNPETVVQLKLMPDAMKQMDKLLDPLLPVKPTAYVSTPSPTNALPNDKFYTPILGGVKTINFHVGDGMYNEMKVANALKYKHELELIAVHGTAEEQQMAKKYLGVIWDIENAILAKPTGKLPAIASFNQYEPPPPTAAKVQAAQTQTAPTGPTWKVSTDRLAFAEKRLINGDATMIDDVAGRVNADGIVIDMGDVKARYIPGGAGQKNAAAVVGQLEVRTAGAVTPETMKRLQDALKDLGVDVTPPSDQYRKTMYLVKNMYYVGKGDLPAEVESILKSKKLSDAERLAQIEQKAATVGIKLAPGDLRWQGQVAPDGTGYRTFWRADITPDELRKQMPGYVLVHRSGQTMPDLIQAFLNSGGEITPTTDRLRKGISLRKTGGMSPETDLANGGGSYYYTRINKKAYPDGQLIFDIGLLGRLDAVSHNGDKYGSVLPKQRAINAAQYKAYSDGSSANETLFKNGFHVTDLKYVLCDNANQRDQVIAIFKKYGITKMADGTPVEDVVRSSRSIP